MQIQVERKMFKIGDGGFAVTLPKAWVRYYGLKPGDKLEVIASDDLTIRVKAREGKNQEALPSPKH